MVVQAPLLCDSGVKRDGDRISGTVYLIPFTVSWKLSALGNGIK